ncbi:MAG TPA: hypothetical protein VJS92_09700 [Candidatus Polarisedimenticolaceae bacterium]|nr:hypothetical protein [Candidatus Polarisedimenticolaceae bacterium]
MSSHDATISLREARERFCAENGPETADSARRWLRRVLGAVRGKAIPLHHLHHVVTGYPTTLLGEIELAAWEIASGCADYWGTRWLDLLTMGLGLIVAPRSTYFAFVRGCHSRNLYNSGFDERLITLSLATLQRILALDRIPPEPLRRDRRAFFWSALASVSLALAPLAVPAAVVLALMSL